MPAFATEQQGQQLSQEALETVPLAIEKVLRWLNILADTLAQHKATPEHANAVRKSGHTFRQSGLIATEQQTKKERREAQWQLNQATQLAWLWHNGKLTYQNCRPWQEKLLREYWCGSLQRRCEETTHSGSAHSMPRMPSVWSER